MKINENQRAKSLPKKMYFQGKISLYFSFFFNYKEKTFDSFFLSKQYSTTWFPIGNYWWLRQILNLVFRAYGLSYKSVFPIDQFTELQI